MYYNSTFNNIKGGNFSKNVVKRRDKHRSNVRSCAFVNSKCRNNVNIIVKNVCNNVGIDVATNDTDKRQVSKPSV